MADFKQILDQRLLLKLSPQQIQFMQLLQLPSLALEQRIKEELENNPALDDIKEIYDDEPVDTSNDDNVDNDLQAATDETTEWNIEDYLSEEDREDDAYKVKDNNYLAEDQKFENPISAHESFSEYLNAQFNMLPISEREKAIGETIIGNIDENGYLQRSADAIANDLAFYSAVNVSVEEVEGVLKKIQWLDPAGVGARDLKECLSIQLQYRLSEENKNTQTYKNLKTALDIINRSLDDFINRRYERMIDKFHLNEAELQEAISIISDLNPKPGSVWIEGTEKNAAVIVPDFYLSFSTNDEPILSLNSRNEPELRINESYNNMLLSYRQDRQNKAHKEAAQFVKEKIDSARWFIDMIRQRQNTLLCIGGSIVNFQKEYLMSGDIQHLKPMILKDIAEDTAFDISTISRVTAQKYMQTPFGIILLKQLFSQSMADDEGNEISTTHIKNVLKTLIEKEDKTQPLPDEELVEALKKEGLAVARRTVAKYRQALGFPVARLRRKLKS